MERIQVAVRSRPLCAEEAKNSPWRISGNSISLSNHPSKFEFDRIFGEECRTVEVYKVRTKEIVSAAVRGFNGTVFAYGQTNSGKTHTMRGSATEPGVIPLAVHDLFATIHEDMDREFLLRMSYMEIYNEEINDLLAPEHRKLQIHESIERGIFVAGLKEEIVASPEQVLELMEYGEDHRHIGETNMNLYSSRSHTIFRMIIESRDKLEGEDSGSSCDAVRVSVLNLVDLAGSERAAKTGAEGVRLKEGSHINKSLMTLGTVIKKLSEGAENQGSHVPYRDSKLTRILQPALGGNANTAIICNITLAQIHADETRSSLQFASRALRVTNCAHVNEILTDAALLKRQKKEIEELRAKLQGSHSEHLEGEILILRNTLLQTELERERIALELEQEKKAQAEREKRLQEQAKKIKNLSSMVLCSNRDENRDYYKKVKRRDTWCPGNLSRETPGELYSTGQAKASAVKPVKAERDVGPLLPFDELIHEVAHTSFCKQEEDCASNAVEDCTLPDARALLHVTSRRKVPLRKKSLLEEDDELAETQAEYENLLLKFESQWIMSAVQIDYLTRKLTEAEFDLDENYKDYSTYHPNKITALGDTNISIKDSEAILVIKQLQEKIKMLEMEKFSSQQNLDCVVELATEQNICARENYEELYEELLNAREDARVAREQLSVKLATTVNEGSFDSMALLMEVHEIISEVHASRNVVESVPSVIDECFESFSAIVNLFADLKSWIDQNSVQLKDIISNHEMLHSSMSSKITELENEKVLLYNQSVDLDNQIQELNQNVQNSAKALTELTEEYEMEKGNFLSQILTLEKEISCLSNCSLAREKEIMRKDLEKTITRLRETEFKLKNAIQEKTKLEGEKACANREIKLLHGQKALLERDISKCDSLAGRRRDSVIDRGSNVFDPKRPKGLSVVVEQTMQEEYKKLEVLAFEMETTIASLEEELTAAHEEKEQVISRNECLVSELHSLSDKLNMSNSELSMLQEEVSGMRLHMEGFKSSNQKLECSFKMLVKQKEEMAMQLTDALLAMEEEKAIWSAKERASVEAIEEKAKSYNAEIMLLSKETSQVKNELESCREQCKVLEERVTLCEENENSQKCSLDKCLRNDQLKDDLKMAGDQESNLEMLSLEHPHACEEVDKLRMELRVASREREDFLTCVREPDAGSILIDDFQKMKNQLLIITMERDKLMTQIEEQQSCKVALDLCKESSDVMAKTKVEELAGRLSKLEVKMHDDAIKNNKVKAKLRMRLQGTQAKLDTFRLRHNEAVDEMDFMNRRYEEASARLKDQLASYGIEVLNLKRQIAMKSND